MEKRPLLRDLCGKIKKRLGVTKAKLVSNCNEAFFHKRKKNWVEFQPGFSSLLNYKGHTCKGAKLIRSKRDDDF